VAVTSPSSPSSPIASTEIGEDHRRVHGKLSWTRLRCGTIAAPTRFPEEKSTLIEHPTSDDRARPGRQDQGRGQEGGANAAAGERLLAARGILPAPLVLKNVRVVNVFTGEVDPPADLAIADGLIVGIGRYAGREEVDLGGRWVCPGLIDGHVHLESSMVTPAEFARAVVPRGTTAVVADPHEIANVSGLEGLRFMFRASEDLPLAVFWGLPSSVPATPFDDANASLGADDLATLLGEPRVVALGEVMNAAAVLSGDPGMAAKLSLLRSAGKVIDGHAPGLSGPDLAAYVLSGVGSDHECITPEEARERLRLGMRLMIREGSAARDLEALLPVVTAANSRRCLLVTDDRNPVDLLREGHLDHLVRKAVAASLDPVTAIRLATINPAEYFGLDRLRSDASGGSGASGGSDAAGAAGPVLGPRGALAPGFVADVVVLDDLVSFRVNRVYVAGRLVAENGRDGSTPPRQPLSEGEEVDGWGLLIGTCHVRSVTPADFLIPAGDGPVLVIEIVPGQIVTRQARLDLPVQDGYRRPNPAAGVVKLAVVERHRGTGRIGKGFVRGLGLAQGALASSVSHDAHNIVVAGADDTDLAVAVRAVAEAGGGLAAVRDGRVVEALPLPIAGLMSDRPLAEVAEGLGRLGDLVRSWGVPPSLDPFMTLSFLTLAAVPELKLTDRGLVDVTRGRLVP
jgi:adenine deaminase